jgi:hypothetical protein
MNEQIENTSQDILLRLTDEELTGILQLIGNYDLPSFLLDEELDTDKLKMIINSLRARDLLFIGEDNDIRANAALIEFIKIASRASRFLVIKSKLGDYDIQNWFYLSDENSILHTNAGDGIQNFQSISTNERFVGLIAASIGLNDDVEGPIGEAITLSKQQYDSIRQTARQSVSDAYKLADGLNPETAKALIEPTISHVVSYTQVDDANQTSSKSFAVCRVDTHFWLIEHLGNTVTISPVAPVDLINRFIDLGNSVSAK